MAGCRRILMNLLCETRDPLRHWAELGGVIGWFCYGVVLALPLLLLLLLVGECRPAQAGDGVFIDDFEQGLAPSWEVKEFAGQTRYQVVADGSGHSLRATSQSAASGLVYPLDLDPLQTPILSWRWKIADTIPGGDARQKATDDYAARVYVIFPHWFFPRTKTLNYIWANRLPQGSAIPSSYTSNSMMIAVRSGRDERGIWQSERHDIVADYRRLFGAEPPRIGAIAIMTDTDNTGATAQAWYDDIELSAQ